MNVWATTSVPVSSYRLHLFPNKKREALNDRLPETRPALSLDLEPSTRGDQVATCHLPVRQAHREPVRDHDPRRQGASPTLRCRAAGGRHNGDCSLDLGRFKTCELCRVYVDDVPAALAVPALPFSGTRNASPPWWPNTASKFRAEYGYRRARPRLRWATWSCCLPDGCGNRWLALSGLSKLSVRHRRATWEGNDASARLPASGITPAERDGVKGPRKRDRRTSASPLSAANGHSPRVLGDRQLGDGDGVAVDDAAQPRCRQRQ